MTRRGSVLRCTRRGGVPARVALLLALLVALAVPPSASAATGGKITGRVTDANGSGLPLGAAYAYRATTGQFVSSSWILLGAYTLSVPDDADYKVYFADTLSAFAVPEFFDDKRSLAEATPVTVRGGATVPDVNAALATGGVISGRVRTTTNGGVSGATVAAYDATTGAFQTSASTGGDGAYKLPAMPPGSYKLFFVGPANSGYISEYYNDKPSLADADPVAVTASRTTSLGDAVLARGGTISGTVTGDDAAPLKNALVAAYTPSGTFVTSAATSATGGYQLPGVPAGDYKILFVGPTGTTYASEYFDDQPTLAAADPVTVSQNGGPTGISARLSKGGRITGRVLDADGRGVEKATVFAYEGGTGAGVRGVFTSADGRYSLDVPEGSFKLIFAPPAGKDLLAEYYDDKPTKDAADPIAVGAGRVVAARDARLAQPGRIAGRVVDTARTPVVGGTVTAYSLDGQVVATATTSKDGTYAIGGLRPASYKVGLRGPDGGPQIEEYFNDRSTLSSADPLSVPGGRTQTLNAELRLEAAFAGTVTSRAGTPIAEATVTAYDPAGQVAGTATADAKGRYAIGRLMPGPYKLRFAGPTGSDYIPEYYHDRSTLALGQSLNLRSGETRTISESLSSPPPPARISGLVRSDSGTRIGGATVTAYTSTGTAAASATTAADGTYAITGLAAGTYRVGFAGPAGGRYIAEFYRDRPTLAQATAIALTTGSTKSIVGALAEVGSFDGIVTARKGGAPIPGAIITAYTLSGDVAGAATADARGAYTLDRLPPGWYRLSFAGPAGSPYIAEYCHDKPTLASAAKLRIYQGRTTRISEALNARPGPATISGTIVDTAKAPVAGAAVTAYLPDGTPAATTLTDGKGGYTLAGLAPGSYRLGFRGPKGARFADQYHPGRPDLASARALVLAHDQKMTVNAALRRPPDPGGIAGTVFGARRQALAAVRVTAFDKAGTRRATASTATDGTYTLTGLAEGDYRVEFAAPKGSPYSSLFSGKATTLATARALTVRAGRITKGVDMQLPARPSSLL